MRVSCSVLNLFVVEVVSLYYSEHRCRLYQMPACASSSQFRDSRAGTSSSTTLSQASYRPLPLPSPRFQPPLCELLLPPPPPIHHQSPYLRSHARSKRNGNAALHFCIASKPAASCNVAVHRSFSREDRSTRDFLPRSSFTYATFMDFSVVSDFPDSNVKNDHETTPGPLASAQ